MEHGNMTIDQNQLKLRGTPTVSNFKEKAKKIVFDYVKSHLEKTDTHVTFSENEVYIVWFGKTLQNWKALISTTLPDGMYYEVTYNGDDNEIYLDAYKKFDNVCIPDDTTAPTESGWYRYSEGNQNMIFLLDKQSQWWVFYDNGNSYKCEWAYIEQAFGVFELVQIVKLNGD
jgi:hypothetical protein